MDAKELESIVLKISTEVSDLRRSLADLISKETRVRTALGMLIKRVASALSKFDRDRYKSTDQRLIVRALADEIRIFDHLGYDIGVSGARFIAAVSCLLEGRNQEARDQFERFITEAEADDHNFRNAHYLIAMVCYNRHEFQQAIEHFEEAFRYSETGNPDWQSIIYIGELCHFLRRPQEEMERVFSRVEEGLRGMEDTADVHFLLSTLFLKWGNCYVGMMDLEPEHHNSLINNQIAIDYYKKARKSLPRYTPPDSLLPVVIDYSLSQALLLAGSVDMDLSMTPSELLEDVFGRLRRVVLTKREETILAQSYFMLGTCACYSPYVPAEVGEIYLENARTQTLTVPSDVNFYSCMTKELLSRDKFVKQIDHYAARLRQDIRNKKSFG
jgi:tetratricopeptide (TPR) repeat protein